MRLRTPLSTGMIVTGATLLMFSINLLQRHFLVLKDVREYALPLAAEIPPLERRIGLLNQQMELSGLEASLRTDSADEKLHMYVLPQGSDTKRLLAFLESARTFLERRSLLKSMSAIELGDPAATSIQGLQSRTVHFTALVKPDGRAQLFSILDLSGMLTVGDVLSQNDIKSLFDMTEKQNYAGIVPVEQFLSSDLQKYVEDPTIPEARLKQAMSSEEFLIAFHTLLEQSRLADVRTLLQSDLGRTLTAQKLWPIQFLTVEKESLEKQSDSWDKVELTIKSYFRQ